MDYKKQNHTLIHHFLERSAEVRPDKVALVHEDIRVTYAEMNNKANRLAHWLIDHGVQLGDRVVILLENSLEYVISYYGTLKAGAVAVPLNTDLKPDGLDPFISELEPKVIISSSRFERLLKTTDLSIPGLDRIVISRPKLAWDSIGRKVLSFEELVTSNFSDFALDLAPCALDLASIIYTSGSTGEAKGVMLSHKNIVSNTHAICQSLQLTNSDIQMVVLPFFYVMGKSLLNTHFAVGGRVVLNNKFAYPASVVSQMAKEKVTGFSGVPATYAYLLHRSPLANYRDKLDSLRYCSQAGGHMSRTIKENLRKTLPAHTQIYVMYGTTEASARLTCLEPERFADKMDSIGKPIPGVGMKVIGTDGKEAPSGQEGELVAFGANIMLGYWNNEESTKKALDRNGYHTGDSGYQDEDGFFYVRGRKDNLVKVRGHRINPQEIEEVIYASRCVIEAVVLCVHDGCLGERLTVMAVPTNSNIDENKILGYCSQVLPKYKIPDSVKWTKALPKNGSGKIDREKCRELAAKA